MIKRFHLASYGLIDYLMKIVAGPVLYL